MPAYTQYVEVLAENEEIIRQIIVHSRGGPAPKIVNFPAPAEPLLSTAGGKAVSEEFVKGMKPLIDALKAARMWEAVHGKRPQHALVDHVSATSTAIAAYVSRFVWILENQGG